jgi:hypothetical protein
MNAWQIIGLLICGAFLDRLLMWIFRCMDDGYRWL